MTTTTPRQRGDRRRPVGNSRKISRMGPISSHQFQFRYQSDTRMAKVGPDDACAAFSKYDRASASRRLLRLGANKSQPIKFRGWRETISAPTKTNMTGKVNEASALTQTINEAALTTGGNAERLSLIARTAFSANQAQASQAALGLILGISGAMRRRQAVKRRSHA